MRVGSDPPAMRYPSGAVGSSARPSSADSTSASVSPAATTAAWPPGTSPVATMVELPPRPTVAERPAAVARTVPPSIRVRPAGSVARVANSHAPRGSGPDDHSTAASIVVPGELAPSSVARGAPNPAGAAASSRSSSRPPPAAIVAAVAGVAGVAGDGATAVVGDGFTGRVVGSSPSPSDTASAATMITPPSSSGAVHRRRCTPAARRGRGFVVERSDELDALAGRLTGHGGSVAPSALRTLAG